MADAGAIIITALVTSLIGTAVSFGIGLLFPPKGPGRQEGPRLESLKVQTSEYGVPIPLVYGKVRTAGNIIWAEDITESRYIQRIEGPDNNVRLYEYFGTFASMICEGPLDEWEVGSAERAGWGAAKILQVYASGILVYNQLKIRGDTSIFFVAADASLNSVTTDLRTFGFQQGRFLVVSGDPNPENNGRFRILTLAGGKITLAAGLVDEEIRGNRLVTVRAADLGVISGTDIGFDTNGTITSVTTDFVAAGVKAGQYLAATISGATYPWEDGYLKVTAAAAHSLTVTRIGQAVIGGNRPGPTIPAGPAVTLTVFYFANRYLEIKAADSSVNSFSGQDLAAVSSLVDWLQAGAAAGQTVTLAGWPDSDNNRTFRIAAVTQRTLTLGAIIVDQAAGAAVTIEDADAAALNANWPMTGYPGNFTQDPDPVHEGAVGAGNCPAYRGRAYAVIGGGEAAGLPLARYGNQIPNVNFLVSKGGTTLSVIITDVCERCGLGAGDINVSAMTDTVRGFIVAHQTDGRGALELLQQGFLFDVADSDGDLHFTYPGASLTTIYQGDLAARDVSDEAADPLSVTRIEELALPRLVEVTYLDPALDYQDNTQRAPRQLTESEVIVSVRLTLAMTSTEAKQLAERMLYRMWSQRHRYQFAAGRAHLKYNPGEVLTVVDKGRAHTVKLTRWNLASINRIAFEAMSEDARVRTVFATGTEGNFEPAPRQVSARSFARFLDIALLRDRDDAPGYYLALSRKTSPWYGAAVYVSAGDDDAAEYHLAAALREEATAGVALTVLPPGPTTYFDEVNAATVSLVGDPPVSVTELEILNGANRCVMGPEIIQFRTATPSGDNWILSGLLRGRLGTEWAIGDHLAGEEVVLLTGPGVLRYYEPMSVVRRYQVVSDGEALDPERYVRYAHTGISQKPWAPVHLQGTRPYLASDQLSMEVADNSINDALGRFLGLGFTPGQMRTYGTAYPANTGLWTAASVTAGKIIFSEPDILNDENVNTIILYGPLALTWHRRSRLHANFAAPQATTPLGEASDRYEVAIMDEDDEDELAVQNVMGPDTGTLNSPVLPATIITPQELQTAFIGEGIPGEPASIRLRVYQISDAVGRGYPGRITV